MFFNSLHKYSTKYKTYFNVFLFRAKKNSQVMKYGHVKCHHLEYVSSHANILMCHSFKRMRRENESESERESEAKLKARNTLITFTICVFFRFTFSLSNSIEISLLFLSCSPAISNIILHNKNLSFSYYSSFKSEPKHFNL